MKMEQGTPPVKHTVRQTRLVAMAFPFACETKETMNTVKLTLLVRLEN